MSIKNAAPALVYSWKKDWSLTEPDWSVEVDTTPLIPRIKDNSEYTHTHNSVNHAARIASTSLLLALFIPINFLTLLIPLPSTEQDPTTMQRTQVYQQQRTQYQNRNYCCEGHMIIGFILSLASAILLYVIWLDQYLRTSKATGEGER